MNGGFDQMVRMERRVGNVSLEMSLHGTQSGVPESPQWMFWESTKDGQDAALGLSEPPFESFHVVTFCVCDYKQANINIGE